MATAKASQQIARISVAEVGERMKRGDDLVFIDTRNEQAWQQAETKLPDAIRVSLNERLPALPRNSTLITYCT